MIVNNSPTTPDPFNLVRFVNAQEDQSIYGQALRELRGGKKLSHWMWFIFPQLEGLGKSTKAQFFALKGVSEARAYLSHPILGPRLLECCRAILVIEGKSAAAIFDSPDDLKLKSSMTLFAHVAGPGSEFTQVIAKYYSGELDPQTIALLNQRSAERSKGS